MLTGNENWVVALKEGEDVLARQCGYKIWFPVAHVDLDCGIITIDVMGRPQAWDLIDVAQIKFGDVFVDHLMLH